MAIVGAFVSHFRQWINHEGVPVVFWIFYTMLPVMGVLVCESLMSAERRVSRMTWAILISIVVGVIVTVVTSIIAFSGLTSRVWLSGHSTGVMWSVVVSQTLIAILTWTVVPLTARLAEAKTAGVRAIALGVAAICLGSYLFYFESLMYGLARASLHGQGPFDPTLAPMLLKQRLDSAAQEAIWVRLDTFGRRSSLTWEEASSLERAVEMLEEVDRPGTARRLALSLTNNPSPEFARLAADTLARGKQYDVVPILFRYAMLRDSKCQHALVQLNIPQVAQLVLLDEIIYQGPAPTADFAIGAGARDQLTRLLGVDLGPNYGAWDNELLQERMNAAPSPISQVLVEETNRVLRAMDDYMIYDSQLRNANARLALLRVDARIRAIIESVFSKPGVTERDLVAAGLTNKDSRDMEAALDKVESMWPVPAPNWNVITTVELEREVKEFGLKVQAQVKRAGAEEAGAAP